MMVIPLAIRITLITLIIVGLIGIMFDSISSKMIPTIERTTISTSN